MIQQREVVNQFASPQNSAEQPVDVFDVPGLWAEMASVLRNERVRQPIDESRVNYGRQTDTERRPIDESRVNYGRQKDMERRPIDESRVNYGRQTDMERRPIDESRVNYGRQTDTERRPIDESRVNFPQPDRQNPEHAPDRSNGGDRNQPTQADRTPPRGPDLLQIECDDIFRAMGIA